MLHRSLKSSHFKICSIALFSLLLKTEAFSEPRFFYRKEARPSMATFVSEPSQTALPINIEVYGDKPIAGARVEGDYYGAGIDTASILPDKYILDQMNLGLLRIGGTPLEIYDFESQLIRRRVFREEQPVEYYSLPSYAEMARSSRSIGGEPLVQVNLVGFKPVYGPDGKPTTVKTDPVADARKFVYYLNKKEKLNIRYFGMGNEPTIWNGSYFDFIKEPIAADDYIDRYVRTVIAMRKASEEIHGDPNFIKVFGPEETNSWTWFQTAAKKDCEGSLEKPICVYGRGTGLVFENFLEYFFYRLSVLEKDRRLNPKGYKLLDYFSFHPYPVFRKDFFDPTSFYYTPEGEQDVNRMLHAIRIWDTDVMNSTDHVFPLNRRINFFSFIHKARKRHYPAVQLAITEFGLDATGESIEYHPLVRPLYEAEMYALSARHGVRYFCKAFLNNDIYNDNSWIMISGGRRTIPSFYAFSLLSKHFLGEFVENSIKGPQQSTRDLVAYTVRNAEGTSTLLINKNVKAPLDFTLSVTDAMGAVTQRVNLRIPELSFLIAKVPTVSREVTVFRYGQEELAVRSTLND